MKRDFNSTVETTKTAEEALDILLHLDDYSRKEYMEELASIIRKNLSALGIIKTKILRVNKLDSLEVRDDIELSSEDCELLLEVLK